MRGEKNIFQFSFSDALSRGEENALDPRAAHDARALPHLASKNALAEHQPEYSPRRSYRDPNFKPETHLSDVFVDDFVSFRDDFVFVFPGRRRRKVVRARAPDEREAEKT